LRAPFHRFVDALFTERFTEARGDESPMNFLNCVIAKVLPKCFHARVRALHLRLR
jgi:hypothetical protein